MVTIPETIGLLQMNAQLFRATARHMDVVLQPLGLRAGTYPFLLKLERAGAVTLEELAELLRLDKGLTSRVCARLIAQDLITKTPDERDARAKRIAITDRGRALVPEIRRALDGWIAEITGGLDETEQAALLRGLANVLERAERVNRRNQGRMKSE